MSIKLYELCLVREKILFVTTRADALTHSPQNLKKTKILPNSERIVNEAVIFIIVN